MNDVAQGSDLKSLSGSRNSALRDDPLLLPLAAVKVWAEKAEKIARLRGRPCRVDAAELTALQVLLKFAHGCVVEARERDRQPTTNEKADTPEPGVPTSDAPVCGCSCCHD